MKGFIVAIICLSLFVTAALSAQKAITEEGKAVLLKDETIDTLFVCKKYAPYYAELQEEFFRNFIQEIK